MKMYALWRPQGTGTQRQDRWPPGRAGSVPGPTVEQGAQGGQGGVPGQGTREKSLTSSKMDKVGLSNYFN